MLYITFELIIFNFLFYFSLNVKNIRKIPVEGFEGNIFSVVVILSLTPQDI